MIEVWMMFTLIVPFCEVVLHTFIDMFRVDENKEVFHNIESICMEDRVVPFNDDVAIGDGKEEIDAKNTFNQNVKTKQARRLNLIKSIARVYMPIFQLVFIAVYWYQGIVHYYK